MSVQLKTLLPQRRNTFIVVAILAVLGTALGLYYFYYIPGNRQRLHQYGFRMLGAISRNIAERNNDLVKLYINNVSGEYRNTPVRDSSDIKAALDSLPDRVKPDLIRGYVQRGARFSGRQAITFTHVRNNVLEYEITSGENAYARLQLPIHKLVGNIISYRHELFDNYIILKHERGEGNIVYQDDSLGLDDRISPDSILARRKGTTFSQIADVSIQGIQYKLFCFPFTLDKEHLVLGGLIKASDYRKRLGSIPVYLVYPLVILLLLILISLPFLKIYLMGPYEQIRFSDLTGLGLAVFGGVTIITMIIVQLLLLARGYMEAAGELKMLSGDIERSMQGEITQIRHQLRHMDTALKAALSVGHGIDKERPVISVKGRSTWRDIPLFPDTGKPYYNFERANWVGNNGVQRWRLQIGGSSRSMLIDVRGRDYFRFFSQQYKDTAAAEEDTAVTLMAPVNSWSGGDFVINFVERSRNNEMLLLTISTKMYSLLNTVLPPGYGFCIIDSKGKVYVHSDADRNLKENFMDEADDPETLKGAINSRQDIVLSNIHCYGKEHTVYLHPLSQSLVMHPVARRSFFLVTFYDNNFMSPVNLRILTFSLVFTLVTSLLVIGWLLVSHGFSRRSLLYRDPLTARFTWIIPRAEDTPVYRNGCLFMAVYLVFLLVPGVFGRVFSDYVTFALGLASPLNILIILYAYRLYCSYPVNTSRRWKTGLYLLLMLCYSMLIYWRLHLGADAGGYVFWIFQLVVILLTALLWMAPGRVAAAGEKDGEERPARLRHYSIFVLVLAVCLGVLPMMVFTWYAHNREIEQSVKKRELAMAVNLEKRRSSFLGLLNNFGPIDGRVKEYFAERCWRQGIYGIHPCCVDPEAPWITTPPQPPRVAEHFYRRITGYLDKDHEEPVHFPVLNQASDNSWYWEPGENSQALHYMPAPGVYPDKLKAFRITMTLPRRYLFLSSEDHIAALALAVLLVLGGLYTLIRSTVSRVFLLDFVRLFGARSKECPEDTLQTDDEIREMILQQRQKSAVFRSCWNRLSGRQRIILLDLVTDGLANYRNVMEISAMTGEGQPLCICDGVIIVKDPVFRQFILEQRLTPETVQLRREFRAQSLWESLRTPLLVVIVAVGGFIFLTQEDISKKMLVLLTTVSSLLPLLPKLLGSFRGPSPPKGEN